MPIFPKRNLQNIPVRQGFEAGGSFDFWGIYSYIRGPTYGLIVSFPASLAD